MLPSSQQPTPPQANSVDSHVSADSRPVPSRGYDKFQDAGQQVRLLQIEPADGSQAALVLSLQIAWLHEKPVYDAISYRWGTPETTKRIDLNVNGISALVSSHLVDAIISLRSRGVRAVWADAICINQSDIDERNAQVPIMRGIYRGARQVHIWLDDLPAAYTKALSGRWNDTGVFDHVPGPALEQVQATQTSMLDYIRRLQLQARPSDTLSGQEFRAKDAPVEPSAASEALRIIEGVANGDCYIDLPMYTVAHDGSAQLRAEYFAGLSCIQWIMIDPYWSRVWIVQEILVASSDPTIHAGSHFTTSFSGFSAAVRGMLDRLFPAGASHEHCCTRVRNMAFSELFRPPGYHYPVMSLVSHSLKRKIPWSLDTVHTVSRMSSATDPRDHVFGMHGLLEKSVAQDIPVDYSLDVAAVFANATRKLYETEGELRYISRAGSSNGVSQLPGLSSWSLPWSKFDFLQAAFSEFGTFANGPYNYVAEKTKDPAELIVRATRIETIADCAQSVSSDSAGFDVYLSTLRSWYAKFVNLPPGILSEKSFDFRETVSFGLKYVQDYAGIPSTDQSFDAYIDEVLMGLSPNPPGAGPLVDGMCFFSTPDGTFGKTREGARVGDEIFILQGCPWPVILRPAGSGAEDDGSKRYVLFCVCYLQDYMHGQGVSESTQWERVALV